MTLCLSIPPPLCALLPPRESGSQASRRDQSVSVSTDRLPVTKEISHRPFNTTPCSSHFPLGWQTGKPYIPLVAPASELLTRRYLSTLDVNSQHLRPRPGTLPHRTLNYPKCQRLHSVFGGFGEFVRIEKPCSRRVKRLPLAKKEAERLPTPCLF